jgi:hypothetical protein
MPRLAALPPVGRIIDTTAARGQAALPAGVDESMQTPDDDDELMSLATLAERTKALQQKVQAVAASPCTGCGAGLCGHEAVLDVVFGHQHAPHCLACLAREHGEAPAELGERALQWIRRRDCFLHVWREAGTAEGLGAVDRAPCLFAVDAAPPPVPVTDLAATDEPATGNGTVPAADADYDAGDLGCGDLVLELRMRLRELAPGWAKRLPPQRGSHAGTRRSADGTRISAAAAKATPLADRSRRATTRSPGMVPETRTTCPS